MANSNSKDETDTLPERPTRIQPYQFEPARQDFERVPVFHGFCEISLTEVLTTQMGVMRPARKSDCLNCINLIHFHLTAGRLRGSSCIVIPGVICELLQFAATLLAGIVNFFVNHTHTQFTEQSKMATALTPQTDVTSGKPCDWWTTQDCSLGQPTENKIN